MSSDESEYMEVQTSNTDNEGVSGDESNESQNESIIDPADNEEHDELSPELLINQEGRINHGASSSQSEAAVAGERTGAVAAAEEHVGVVNEHAVAEELADALAEERFEIKLPVRIDQLKKEASCSSPKNNTSLDDDGQMCTICFEPWTSSGQHRLVSLRCGHLFGKGCISKWLIGQAARCPQCNARARKSEMRPIYARTLKVLDTSERDRALKELEKESQMRKKAEIEAVQMRLKYQMAMQEYERLKKELMQAQTLLQSARSVKAEAPNLLEFSKPRFHLIKTIELNKIGGCRIMDICYLLGIMVVSQPSTNPLFPGYGIKKMSVPDFTPAEFVCIHQKPIKDISFHGHDSLVLTASLDKTVKLTNFLSNSIVQSYNLSEDVWSCSWDYDDPWYFYAGVRTGLVYLFDIRVTNKHILTFPKPASASPAVSMRYLHKIRSAPHSKSGPIAAQLSNCCFYEKVLGRDFIHANPLPIEGRFTSLSVDPATGHFLASCRPSAKHARVSHMLCEFSFQPDNFSCNVVQTFEGGATQAQLTRSKLLPHPDTDSSVLVCAGDEDTKSALVWDGSTGIQLDSLKADSIIVDMVAFRDSHGYRLATLTEKNLRIYSWSSM